MHDGARSDATRPDAALGLEGVPHTGESITADGMLVEPQAGGLHARPSRRPATRTGSRARCSTRCWCARSPTPTATAPATCAGSPVNWTTWQWLGVDCLWLPPFYASPLRDGGYDICDFRAVLPEFGSVEDFVYLLDEAHKRNIRVITDLVLNHTSDAHPWFQQSRADPDGPYGDYYVWSDDDSRYADARIIFVDTETSNWTYDPVRGQFYWHRFFSHQPDLNYENPDVQDAMLDVLRFWLDLGHRRVPAGRRALPVRAGGHQLREPAAHARVPQALPQGRRRRVPGPDPARRGQPVALRRRRVLRRPGESAATSATWRSTSR